MTGPVVDCSVAAAWVLADESSEAADSILERVVDEGGLAPSLWWAEIRNSLVTAERRRRIAPADTEHALATLDRLAIDLDHTPGSAMVLRLAQDHALTAYDAIYLELALRRSRALATLDRKLAAAARSAGIAVPTEAALE